MQRYTAHISHNKRFRAAVLEPHVTTEVQAIDPDNCPRLAEYDLSGLDIDYLAHHHGSTPMAVSHDALDRVKGNTQRWMAETSSSTTKRTQDSALRSRFWHRQFREIILMFANHKIKKVQETMIATMYRVFNRAVCYA